MFTAAVSMGGWVSNILGKTFSAIIQKHFV